MIDGTVQHQLRQRLEIKQDEFGLFGRCILYFTDLGDIVRNKRMQIIRDDGRIWS